MARTAGPLPDDVYVWQRQWTPSVRDAVTDARREGSKFRHVVALGAEVRFEPDADGFLRPQVTRTSWDPSLADGVALRIGRYSGTFSETDDVAKVLTEVAREMTSADGGDRPRRDAGGHENTDAGGHESPDAGGEDEADAGGHDNKDAAGHENTDAGGHEEGADRPRRDAGGHDNKDAGGHENTGAGGHEGGPAAGGSERPTELEIDFDAGASQLAGYAKWLRALRQAVPADVRLVATLLPDHVGRDGLADVLAVTDGVVLQVHGLPAPNAPRTLLDADRARRAVEALGETGEPFRVAMPAYEYAEVSRARADGSGDDVLGVVAEASGKLAPGLDVRPVRAAPEDVAGLVRAWTADRPATLEGLIWFRLPVPGDAHVTSLPALEALIDGRVPVRSVHVEATDPPLVDLVLVNDGEADVPLDQDVVVDVRPDDVVAADGASGYTVVRGQDVRLRPDPALAASSLPPGARRPLGWLRLASGTPVHAAPDAARPAADPPR